MSSPLVSADVRWDAVEATRLARHHLLFVGVERQWWGIPRRAFVPPDSAEGWRAFIEAHRGSTQIARAADPAAPAAAVQARADNPYAAPGIGARWVATAVAIPARGESTVARFIIRADPSRRWETLTVALRYSPAVQVLLGVIALLPFGLGSIHPILGGAQPSERCCCCVTASGAPRLRTRSPSWTRMRTA